MGIVDIVDIVDDAYYIFNYILEKYLLTVVFLPILKISVLIPLVMGKSSFL